MAKRSVSDAALDSCGVSSSQSKSASHRSSHRSASYRSPVTGTSSRSRSSVASSRSPRRSSAACQRATPFQGLPESVCEALRTEGVESTPDLAFWWTSVAAVREWGLVHLDADAVPVLVCAWLSARRACKRSVPLRHRRRSEAAASASAPCAPLEVPPLRPALARAVFLRLCHLRL